MKLSSLKKLVASTFAAIAMAPGAMADNTAFTTGDLVLFLQKEGGANTVYATLGNTATEFRGAATGPDVPNKLNIININSQLTAAFGPGWANDATVYAGLAGVWGTSGNLSNALQNGDPHRTLYVSQSRIALGTPGQPESGLSGGYGDGGMSAGANAIVDQNIVFATGLVSDTSDPADGIADESTGPALVSPVGFSRIDDNNPFLAQGVQDNAFGIFAGGVQQVGASGEFGTFGGVANVEFALDLYRIQAKNTISGQVGQGEPIREGTYEGTVLIDSAGNVHFITQAPPAGNRTLITSATTNGTITGVTNGGIYPSGATATLTANPALGYDFTGWTVDASGTANPLMVLMNADKTIGANFTKASNYDDLVPTISSTSPLPNGQTGKSYSVVLTATGGVGPFTWSLETGSLPAGLTLGAGGMLSGVPTTLGTSNFSVSVTGSNGGTDTKALSLEILEAPTITTPTALSAGTLGQSFSRTLTATGGSTPYVWSLVGGSLPAGMTLSPTGTVSGTPTTSGAYAFTARVTGNDGPFTQKAFTWFVRVAPTITTVTPLASATAGGTYSRTLAASGGVTPYTWSLAGGTLPPGTSLSAAGVLSGNPSTAGTYVFTARVTGSDGATSTKGFGMFVVAAPTFTTAATLPAATRGQAYSRALGATGGVAPYTYSVAGGSSLPPGMNLSPSGVLSGTPSAGGNQGFTVLVTDSNASSGTRAFTLPVRVAPTITTVSPLLAGTFGVNYNRTFTATGGEGPYTWSLASGALPPGLTLASDGVLSGSPSDAGQFSFSVKVTGSDGAFSSKAMSLAVVPSLPSFSFASNTVTMTTTTPGAVIRYTTNGTMPSAASSLYNPATGLPLQSGKWTIKARAFKNGVGSALRTANYTVYLPIVNFAFIRSSVLQPDGRRYTHYFTQQASVTRDSQAKSVYFKLNLPTAASREGGLACYYGLQILRDLVLAGDVASFKFGGEAPYDGMASNVWSPLGFSTVPNIDLQPGMYYFKVDLAGTDDLAPGAPQTLKISLNVQVARLLDNAGQAVAALNSNPLWLVFHGSADGENGVRAINTALRSATATSQVLSVDWARPASMPGSGIYYLNFGRNLAALLTTVGFQPSDVNLVTHSLGSSVGFETAFRFGGVNRFIALDPAAQAGGGYDDSRVNFSEATLNGETVDVSVLATAVKSGAPAGTFGNDAMAGKADYTLRLLSNVHTGNLRNSGFFRLLPKDWFVRSMTSSADAYWPFMKDLMLISQTVPWTGVDMGSGIDVECHGTTNFMDNAAPAADVVNFQSHNFLRFKNTSGALIQARATTSGATTSWTYTP